VGTLAPGAFFARGVKLSTVVVVRRTTRTTSASLLNRQLKPAPVCFAPRRRRDQPESDHARKSLRLFDEEHRTKEDVRLDRQLRVAISA